jgi:hypothetical protein
MTTTDHANVVVNKSKMVAASTKKESVRLPTDTSTKVSEMKERDRTICATASARSAAPVAAAKYLENHQLAWSTVSCTIEMSHVEFYHHYRPFD